MRDDETKVIDSQKIDPQLSNALSFMFFKQKLAEHVIELNKTKKKWVDQNSINHTFFAFRNIPNKPYIQKKLRFRRFC